MTTRRPPEEVLRDKMMRRRMEAAQHVLGELAESTSSLGENMRELLREEAALDAFEDRQAGRALPSTFATSGSITRHGGGDARVESQVLPSWPPVMHPPNVLGTAFNFSRPLTVGASSSAAYLTSSNAISYTRGSFQRKSSLTTLPSEGELKLPLRASTSTAGLGGRNALRAEDPLRISRTLGFMQHDPSVAAVLEARWPNTSWNVLSTAPYRPALRAAIQGLGTDDQRWVNGNWVPRREVSTPRSERMARHR